LPLAGVAPAGFTAVAVTAPTELFCRELALAELLCAEAITAGCKSAQTTVTLVQALGIATCKGPRDVMGMRGWTPRTAAVLPKTVLLNVQSGEVVGSWHLAVSNQVSRNSGYPRLGIAQGDSDQNHFEVPQRLKPQ